MPGHSLVVWLHILASSALLGTSGGVAYVFARAQRGGDPALIAAVAREAVAADLRFTLTALTLLPLTGVFIAVGAGYPLAAPWLKWSMALYLFVGACWLPVMWLLIRLRGMAAAAAAAGSPLPPAYRRYYAWWLALGWAAFAAILAIVYLMVAKPGT